MLNVPVTSVQGPSTFKHNHRGWKREGGEHKHTCQDGSLLLTHVRQHLLSLLSAVSSITEGPPRGAGPCPPVLAPLRASQVRLMQGRAGAAHLRTPPAHCSAHTLEYPAAEAQPMCEYSRRSSRAACRSDSGGDAA